jgi:hypothetical protein
MSILENRKEALAFAIAVVHGRPDVSWQTTASDALNFLETGGFVPGVGYAPSVPPPADAPPTTAAPVTRKPRATKHSVDLIPTGTAVTGVTAATAVTVSTAATVSTATVASTPVAAATPNKAPTLDDVRNALVQCQTRKGSKEPSMVILRKYTAPAAPITGNVPSDKYAALIAECAAA